MKNVIVGTTIDGADVGAIVNAGALTITDTIIVAAMTMTTVISDGTSLVDPRESTVSKDI